MTTGACVNARAGQRATGLLGRGVVKLGLALLAAACALALGVSPAGAVVARINGHGFGVTPRRGVSPRAVKGAYRPGRAPRRYDEPPVGGTPLKWEGGPVMHSNNTHVVYWDPEGEFTSTTKTIIEAFFTDVAHDSGLASNVFGVDAQFTDGTGHAAYKSTFGGALTDSAAYPTSECTAPTEFDSGPPYTHCLTDAQLQSQLSTFISEQELPRGSTQLYFLLLPHTVATCFEGGEAKSCSTNEFCAYHSYISPGTAGEIIYADIPFSLLDSETTFGFIHAKGCQADANEAIQIPNGDTAGTNASTRYADVALKYISHEYSEAITDPLVGTSAGAGTGTAWVDVEGFENGDKCNAVPYEAKEEGEPGFDKHAFTPTLGGSASEGTLYNQAIDGGHFYLQSEWDNAARRCLMKPLELTEARIIAPATGTPGEPIFFEGPVKDAYKEASGDEVEYSWDFGDGATSTQAEPVHEYSAPGSYEVTMTARDSLTGSTSAPVVKKIEIDEPPTAAFTIEPSTVAQAAAVHFDASASSDPDGSIVGYEWAFGDGAKASSAEPKAEHAYAAPGVYSVTLTVTDNGAHTGSVVHTVSVVRPPSTTTEPALAVATSSSATLLASPTAVAATVSLSGTSLGTKKGGAAAVRLSCTGNATCAGRLTLTVKVKKGKRTRTVTIGTASYAVRAGSTATVTVKLSLQGRALLGAARGRLSASLAILKSSPAPSATQRRAVRLVRKR